MTPEEMKEHSRNFGVDMSGEAVARRIDTVSRLRELGLALMKAQVLDPVGSTEPSAAIPTAHVNPPNAEERSTS